MKRIAELDGLRAVAILMVVAWHYLGTGDDQTWHLFIVGRSGVDLFFVLSGYLITGILLTNRESPNYFPAFYGRRSLRILPIYFVMVAIYLVGRKLGGSAPMLFDGPLPWWSYVIGLQNVWMTICQDYGAAWLGATWSLAVEEQFYLVFPLIVYLMPPRLLPRLLIGLLVLCPIGRIVAYALGDRFGYYVLMPLRADILAIGALVAWLEFSGAISASVRRSFRMLLWATVCFLPVFAWGVENSNFNMAVWGHTYLVALYGSILFMVLDNRGAARLAFLRSRSSGFIARISYALYLTHGYVLVLVFLAAGYNAHTILTWRGIALTTVALALSIAICTLSYRLVEGPLIRLAHRRFRFEEAETRLVGDALTVDAVPGSIRRP
jgi:peptidoglycan/LPS O-acetylase OafA/YrhL